MSDKSLKNMGKKIRTIRLEKGLTLEEFGKLFNTSKVTIFNWEKGRNYPNKENLKILADLAGMTVEELLGDNDATDRHSGIISKIVNISEKLEPPRQSKVLDFASSQLDQQNNVLDDWLIEEAPASYTKVQATEKLSAGQGYSYGDNQTATYYTNRDDLKPYDYATVVSGDSMTPKFHDGDVVLLTSGYDNVNGAVYAIDYKGESFLKRVFYEGDRIRLVSYNPNYQDITIYLPVEEGDYFNIIGKVVDHFQPIQVN